MSLGVPRFDPDALAVRGDRIVDFADLQQSVAEAELDVCVIRARVGRPREVQ